MSGGNQWQGTWGAPSTPDSSAEEGKIAWSYSVTIDKNPEGDDEPLKDEVQWEYGTSYKLRAITNIVWGRKYGHVIEEWIEDTPWGRTQNPDNDSSNRG